MKILFQGSWKEGRNAPATKALFDAYCLALAEYTVKKHHTLVLTSNRESDKVVADKLIAATKLEGSDIKNHLMYLLPKREQSLPLAGRVVTIDETSWLIEERTYAVRYTDALIAIGGGKGTFDCTEKAFLSNKPVFVAVAIPSAASNAWKKRPKGYKYLADGDADIFDDVNVSPEEYCRNVFAILNALAEVAYSRRIFIVHGHDLYRRNQLVALLKKLDFEPIYLEKEAGISLTVIEKLERDTEKVGFSFVLYTPDDLGRQQGGVEMERARQNVIFEHGLLIGLLGRERTCAIIKGGLEIPSDIKGMLYEEVGDLEAVAEALKIVKVLKDAGYKIDISKLP
jgi:predicted nucleotide-binding protein